MQREIGLVLLVVPFVLLFLTVVASVAIAATTLPVAFSGERPSRSVEPRGDPG